MPKPKRRKTADLPTPSLAPQDRNVERLTNIVRAMDYLARESRKSGIEEVVTVVESAFRIMSITHRIVPLDGASDPHPANLRPLNDNDERDVTHLETIVSALKFLSEQAAKTGDTDAAAIIDAAFAILQVTYYCILRHGMMDLPPGED